MNMLFPTAIALGLLASLPAQAQSDRYTRPQPQATPGEADQQAQTPDRKRAGEVETLRRDHMSSPNVQGESVPENPATGVPAPELRDQPKREEGGVRP